MNWFLLYLFLFTQMTCDIDKGLSFINKSHFLASTMISFSQESSVKKSYLSCKFVRDTEPTGGGARLQQTNIARLPEPALAHPHTFFFHGPHINFPLFSLSLCTCLTLEENATFSCHSEYVLQ